MDRKRRRVIAHSRANGNCNADGFRFAELNPESYSSRMPASDTCASPDPLSLLRSRAP
jgi:hypothetical protein